MSCDSLCFSESLLTETTRPGQTGIEKYWRDSKIGAIHEGSSNIQLDTIARFIKKQYAPPA